MFKKYFKKRKLKDLEYIISKIPPTTKIEYLLKELPKTVNGDWLNIQICGDRYFSWYGHHIDRIIFEGGCLEDSLTQLLYWCKENKYCEKGGIK